MSEANVDTEPVTIPLHERSRTYVSLVAVVAVLLLAGLMVPMLAGEREQTLAGGDLGELNVDAIDDQDGTGSDGGLTDGATTTTVGAAGPVVTTPDGQSATPGSTATTPGGPTTTAAGPSEPLTASDVGVTASTIKLGLLTPTASSAGSTTDQSAVQVAQVSAFLDEINDNGGIYGRQVELAVATYDILDQNAGARAGCLKLADDQKVFAVLNTTGYGPPGALCLTREKKVPFLQGTGHPEEVYAQAEGLYSSTFDNQTRHFRNMVSIMDNLDALQGKIGVLGTEWLGLRREQEDGIVKTLRARGYDPFVYWLSGDPVSSQAQIPIALLQMRNAGVKTVLLGADFVSSQSFVQLGNTQSFRPRYGAADPWGYTSDFIVANFGPAFNDAISVTARRTYDARVGVGEPALDAQCRGTVEARTSLRLDRANDPQALYTGSMLACGIVRRFHQAALAAGPNLTRAGLVQAIGQMGTVDVPFAGGPATYTPNKLDGSNHYRAQRFDGSCKCWQPLTSAFAPGEYR